MAKLKEEVKRFIVMELACYRTPTEVAEAVQGAFGVEISRQRAYSYNPHGAAGHQVAKKWKDLHDETRKRFLEDTSGIAVAQKSYRLQQLNEMAQRAKAMKNYRLAAQLMEQAAKECGSLYTNRRELSGRDGRPIAAIDYSEWSDEQINERIAYLLGLASGEVVEEDADEQQPASDQLH